MDGIIRQGDILLVPLDETDSVLVKEDAIYQRRRKGEGIIVAEGEATGHHHRIRTLGARMYRRGRTMYVSTPKQGAELTHEEHETLTIPHGFFRVEHQREYQPKATPRRVYD